jgi:broad specificity phosphatase PhoE
MAIVLVRHGETALNAARVLQPADTPLSARGQAQAAAVARRLAARGDVAAVLSSDLPRAWATAQAIAAAAAAPLQSTALLQERNFGALRGRPYDALGFDPLQMAEAPPGGESAADFERRVQAAFVDMCRHAGALDADLVVVTHGLLIRRLLAGPLRCAADTLDGLHLGNTSVSIFDARPPHALQLLNCTLHLQDAAQDDARALSGG